MFFFLPDRILPQTKTLVAYSQNRHKPAFTQKLDDIAKICSYLRNRDFVYPSDRFENENRSLSNQNQESCLDYIKLSLYNEAICGGARPCLNSHKGKVVIIYYLFIELCANYRRSRCTDFQ